MANLNLSEFGEKTFVADADHTFIWDTAASISKRVSRNSWLSGTTADFHLGLADAASPVAQTISVQSVVAGTTNTAGVNLSINGSQGTGTGAGGSLLLRTAPAGSSGTTQNALVTAVAITAAGNVGIGTTSPSSKLHVVGAVSAGSSDAGYQLTNGTLRVSGWGNNQGSSLGGLGLSSSFVLGWASGVDGGNFGLLDTILLRDEQYHLALRNGTNGQKFSVYGTYPGAAWERFTITAPTSGNVLLGTYRGTGGIARGLEFQTDGVSRWSISTGGNLIPSANNTYNIGANGGLMPANVYVANAIVTGGDIFSNARLIVNTISSLGSPGPIKLTDFSGSDFSRLQLGGTADTHPAIARDGAGIKFTGAAAGSTSWIKVPPVAVGSLPLAATAGAGARAFVNDALAPTFGSAVTGGGAVLVPVYSDGSAWNVG